MLPVWNHLLRRLSSMFADTGPPGFLAPGIAAVCAVAIGAGQQPLRAQPVASLWGTQAVVADSANSGGGFVPMGVAVDGSGAVYFADAYYNRVAKATLVNGSYAITTVASGINHPQGVAVDRNGNVYIAEPSLMRVLKETPLAEGGYAQSVVADGSTGFGLMAPQGVAVDDGGNVYIADIHLNKVVKETPVGDGVYVQSVVADRLNGDYLYPRGVAVDGSGNVYVTDSIAGALLKETPAGGGLYTQSVVIDSGLNNPSLLAVDGSGSVFIADYNNGRVVKATPLGNGLYAQSEIANASANGLMYPYGVAVDRDGSIYLAEPAASKVWKDMVVSVGFGSLPVGAASPAIPVVFRFSTAVTLNSTTPYQVLTGGATGQDFTAAGGSATAGKSYAAGSTCTVDVTFSPLAPGTRMGAVVLFDAAGNTIGTACLRGTGLAPQVTYLPGTQSVVADGGAAFGISSPEAIGVDGSGNVYIGDTGLHRVVKETPSGGAYVQSEIIKDPTGQLAVNALALDGAGNVYLADSANHCVLKETRQLDGSYAESLVVSNLSVFGVAVDAGGCVYVTVADGNRVLKETPSDGGYAETVVADSALGVGFSIPIAVAVDGSGNVYVVDGINVRVVKETLQPDGSYQPSLVGSGLVYPNYVSVDAVGNVYIAETGNHRVLKETLQPDGSYVQSVLADAGAPYDLDSPIGIAVDPGGNVYIGDVIKVKVVKENLADPPTLAFGSVAAGATSDTQSIQVVNGGNRTLTAVAPGLAVSSGFTQEAGTGTPPDCTATFSLLPGAAANLSLAFTPGTGASGAMTGSVVLTDNHLNLDPGIQTIGLTGTAVSTQGVAPAITSLPATTFTVGTAGSFTVTATGSPAPTFTESGALPDGVTLGTSGTLGGTPAAGTGGSYPITITASNGVSPNGTQAFTLTVNEAPAITSLPGATFTVGTSGSFTVTATGNPAPTFTASGALPAGVTLSASGLLSGKPGTGSAGSYPILITASNGVSPNGTQAFTLTVQAPAGTLSLAPAALPPGTVGIGYKQGLTVSGGTKPYASSLASGALPAGLAYAKTMVLSGTPKAGGDFTFTIQATDAMGRTGSQAYTLTISPPAITLAPATLPAGTLGKGYKQTLKASGGTPPYAYAVTSGSLPGGLGLSPAGALSGVPSARGSFSFTIGATDSSVGTAYVGTKAYTLVVK